GDSFSSDRSAHRVDESFASAADGLAAEAWASADRLLLCLCLRAWRLQVRSAKRAASALPAEPVTHAANATQVWHLGALDGFKPGDSVCSEVPSSIGMVGSPLSTPPRRGQTSSVASVAVPSPPPLPEPRPIRGRESPRVAETIALPQRSSPGGFSGFPSRAGIYSPLPVSQGLAVTSSSDDLWRADGADTAAWRFAAFPWTPPPEAAAEGDSEALLRKCLRRWGFHAQAAAKVRVKEENAALREQLRKQEEQRSVARSAALGERGALEERLRGLEDQQQQLHQQRQQLLEQATSERARTDNNNNNNNNNNDNNNDNNKKEHEEAQQQSRVQAEALADSLLRQRSREEKLMLLQTVWAAWEALAMSHLGCS
ncbi:unnamed protein product, partial [Polarella glacialis]